MRKETGTIDWTTKPVSRTRVTVGFHKRTLHTHFKPSCVSPRRGMCLQHINVFNEPAFARNPEGQLSGAVIRNGLKGRKWTHIN